MIDIDRQIELAKKKPLTAESLNYIGDLYLKKDDKQRAVVYLYEAADKLHFAQKEKKIAIYKKILKISPISEKAYIGIIEILSKMGLVMEEKKYLHMLAQLYENRGDAVKASDLLAKIRELDPHVIPDGTFFHPEAQREVIELGADKKMRDTADEENKNVAKQQGEQAKSDNSASVPAEPINEEKLIEASLEEIPFEDPYPSGGLLKKLSLHRYLLGGVIVCIIVLAAGALFYFRGNQAQSGTFHPVSVRLNDYDITISNLDDRTELTGVVSQIDLDSTDFLILTVNNPRNCIPEAFATAPYNMISLRGRKGEAIPIKPVQGLQKTTRAISKMNVCGRDNATVHVRTILALKKQGHYSGLEISGLQSTGPLRITWDSR